MFDVFRLYPWSVTFFLAFVDNTRSEPSPRSVVSNFAFRISDLRFRGATVQTAGSVINTILKHDKKQNTYKIALFRAINDVIYSYPNLYDPDRRLAIPLRSLGAYWIAYYWPFCFPHNPIIQGNRHHRYGKLSQDMAFRKKLTALVEEWDAYVTGKTKPSDGYCLMNELRTTGPGRDLPETLYDRYDSALTKVKQSIKQPIRYSGSGEWDLFANPCLSVNWKRSAPSPSRRPNTAKLAS